MTEVYNDNDYRQVKELMRYPDILVERLDYFSDTSEIEIPEDPIENVIFQERAKAAIRGVAHNKGHILMAGLPGTGKSLLADMFKRVLDESLGDYLRPREAIVAYPGKDKNHIRIAYEDPEAVDERIESFKDEIEEARRSADVFSLGDQIESVRRVKVGFILGAIALAIAGLFFPPAFIGASLAGIGAIFMFMQENNHRVQEKIQRDARAGAYNPVKHLTDQVPEVLFDPRKDKELMARISEPGARNMKGGFRHDPYQSGNLHTPAHVRAYLGAHATAPIIYIDELKTMIKVGFMSDLLEIMQNKSYLLEGGDSAGSGSADRSENRLKADNIIVASCNFDTLGYLQNEGDGAFLSRIEDKGEIIRMESEVPETRETTRQAAQYVKQEIDNLGKVIRGAWGEVLEKEGWEGVRLRSEKIFGRPLAKTYRLRERDFSMKAVLEIIKELRSRSADEKLSAVFRPINGIIRTAEYEAIQEDSALVEPAHVRKAVEEHMSLEGAMSREMVKYAKNLKIHISSLTNSIGYVVGLAVFASHSGSRMYGHPMPIRCQINAGSRDAVVAPGKLGDIAKAAAQNVRASIKKALKSIGAPHVGYEMHVEYIQAHSGVEGDSASVAMDIGLISDFIKRPVNQRFAVTGSLTGDIILAVGGVTEKVRSIMDPSLGMSGACIPWQNRHDVEPLLINAESEYIREDEIPGIRILRTGDDGDAPFDIFFCKTKFNAYKILMGLGQAEVEGLMEERSGKDLDLLRDTWRREPGEGQVN
ncbi:MAG: hypothetical protein GY859_24760 [Desulfobacterales bacterium]|nr:hypothetical protein [Desulfobacterales bacterium]